MHGFSIAFREWRYVSDLENTLITNLLIIPTVKAAVEAHRYADIAAWNRLFTSKAELYGKAATISTYATGLDHPLGIAFYPSGAHPQWMYVGNATTVVRFAYNSGDLKATGSPQTTFPISPDMLSFVAAVTEQEMWCSPQVTSICSSRSEVDRMQTILIRIQMNSIELTCWNIPLMASSLKCMPMAFATAWAKRFYPTAKSTFSIQYDCDGIAAEHGF
jgi:hypothetical protein